MTAQYNYKEYMYNIFYGVATCVSMGIYVLKLLELLYAIAISKSSNETDHIYTKCADYRIQLHI